MISVIIPIYNTEKYLPRCIDSILQQTYRKLEIILVDDGSTDSSGDICDTYSLRDARIQVIHKENGGLVSARQAGILMASGEYIGFVDSDDWIEPDMYQVLYGIAVSENTDIVAEGVLDDFDGECIITRNRLLSGRYEVLEQRKYLYENMVSCKEYFCLGIMPYVWNKIFRRQMVLQHMLEIPLDIRVGEDAAAVYPMFAMAESISILDTAHYHYCHHGNSMMLRERDEDKEYANAVLLDAFLKRSFQKQGIYHIVEEQLFRYSVNNMLTRSYGRFAGVDSESILFPYSDIRREDGIVVYGAGAFGRAVYQYMISCLELSVKAWMDQNAVYYRRTGLAVSLLEETDIARTDKVVVAVFSESAYLTIRESLMDRGVEAGQIQWINKGMLEKYFRREGWQYDAEEV